METLIKTNDLVYVSWIKHQLSTHNIEFLVLDESMAITEGNISAIPIRIVVSSENLKKARNLINTNS